MAQLCLYVEDDLMTRLKDGAKRENVSVSKYVKSRLSDLEPRNKWSDSFWATFGAISDPTFTAPAELNWDDDVPRTALD